MAKLSKITVRGFKSIRALDDFELRSLNVLIGANSVGKSNFIGLFRMLADWLQDYALGELRKMNILGGRPTR